MGKKRWPALKSCKRKRNLERADGARNLLNQLSNEILLISANLSLKARVGEVSDRLSQLPDDILLATLSSLTMEEVARMSVLSHRWNYMWRCFSILNFEDSRAMRKIVGSNEVLQKEQSSFIRWVNHVVHEHQGPVIDKLRVTFDLNISCQSHVDKWVVFAFEKQVRTLELDLKPVRPRIREEHNCTLPLDLPRALVGIKPPLTSLSLNYVNVNADEIECLLRLCPLLENLCIVDSAHLTTLRVSGCSLNLKNLEVSRCSNLEKLDIDVPKLTSFTQHGLPTELHIVNAPLLSELSIGGYQGHPINYAFDSLSKYFSQLEHLSLLLCLNKELNLAVNHSLALANLKHLELLVIGSTYQSLLGWTPLIEASPVLEKLTLKMVCGYLRSYIPIIKRDGRPLQCLKTLELGGFRGRKMDLEFATYVFRNAVILKEVTVDFTTLFHKGPICKDDEKRISKLQRILPEGVKLTIK